MVRGSQNWKSQTTHNQGTPQAPVAKKPPTINNDVPTLIATLPDCWLPQAHKITGKGNYQHTGEDPCTRGQSLLTWGANNCFAGCQQSSTKHGWCTGAILMAGKFCY